MAAPAAIKSTPALSILQTLYFVIRNHVLVVAFIRIHIRKLCLSYHKMRGMTVIEPVIDMTGRHLEYGETKIHEAYCSFSAITLRRWAVSMMVTSVNIRSTCFLKVSSSISRQ